MPKETAPPSGDLSGVRVLVVDDDASCRRAYGRVLVAAGATVETASGAKPALAAFHRTQPHVVVSDLVMPDQDGAWLMRQILAAVGPTERRPRGIVVTGQPAHGARAQSIAAGFDVFLTKPIDAVVLSAAVAWLARDGTPPQSR